jgi:hypothetical protein
MLQCEAVNRAEQMAQLTPLPLLLNSAWRGVTCRLPFISSITMFCERYGGHEIFAAAHACHSKYMIRPGWLLLGHLNAIRMSAAPDQPFSAVSTF